jgi:hypothetical protein
LNLKALVLSAKEKCYALKRRNPFLIYICMSLNLMLSGLDHSAAPAIYII